MFFTLSWDSCEGFTTPLETWLNSGNADLCAVITRQQNVRFAEDLFHIGEWFLSWFFCLSNSYHLVNASNISIRSETLGYGVPQGSGLGPVLFSLYTGNELTQENIFLLSHPLAELLPVVKRKGNCTEEFNCSTGTSQTFHFYTLFDEPI